MVDDMMIKLWKELSQMGNHRHQNKQSEMKNIEIIKKASNGTDKRPTPKPSNQRIKYDEMKRSWKEFLHQQNQQIHRKIRHQNQLIIQMRSHYAQLQ